MKTFFVNYTNPSGASFSAVIRAKDAMEAGAKFLASYASDRIIYEIVDSTTGEIVYEKEKQ